MKTTPLKALIASFFLCALGVASAAENAEDRATVEETIALARSYLGDTEKLDAVRTLRMRGVIVDGGGGSGAIEILYKKPLSSKVITSIGGIREVSTLKGSEAWRRVERVDQPGVANLEFYSVADIRRMQAVAREVLNFMGKPTSRRGEVTYEGTEEVDGRQTRVLVYHHGGGIWFRQYVDAETGRVLQSTNDLGMSFRESGEIVADGIRFPARVITRTATPRGVASMEISFSSVEVNGKIDDSVFDVPSAR